MKKFALFLPILLMVCASCDKEDDTQSQISPFSGYWNVTDTCGGNVHEYEMLLASSSSDETQIYLFNLNNKGYASGVYGTTRGDSFFIPLQTWLRYQVSGYGYLNSEKDSLFYYWEGGPNGNCTAGASLRPY